MRIVYRSLFLVMSIIFLSCTEPEVIIRYQEREVKPGSNDLNTCSENSDCKEDEVCVDGKCINTINYPCKNGQSPLLLISSELINFGSIKIGKISTKTLEISNVGTCTLNISKLQFENQNQSEFTCPRCNGNDISLAPTQSLKINLIFSSQKPGLFSNFLILESNDYSINANGKIKLLLKNEFNGEPRLVLQPSELNWGYVPFLKAKTKPLLKTIRLSNFGTGLGAVFIEKIHIEGDHSFLISENFIKNFKPFWFQPTTFDDESTYVDIPIQFEASDFENHSAKLIVTGWHYNNSQVFQATAVLTASSKGEPRISVNLQELLFRAKDNEPLLVGSVSAQEVKITNTGESELVISDIDAPLISGFSFFPSFFPAIFPGESVFLNVFFAPSFVHTPKDASQSFSIQNSNLFIKSNDPKNPTKTISLIGWTKKSGDETLTIEMTFDNSQTGLTGNDFRNVDLEIISPTGFSCAKPKPIYSSSGKLSHFRNYCDEWNDFKKEGKTHWIALGQFEKPERISLYDLDKSPSLEQIFTVRVHYVEDCSYLPSDLLANVLGIGTSLLTSILAGQAGATVSTSPTQISEAISKNCFSHSPTLATIRFLTNGKELASPQIFLFQKGDYHDVMKISYRNNHFEITQ